MATIRYAPQALNDLKTIAGYTRRAWANAQAKSYIRKLAADVRKLQDFPARFAIHEPSGLGLRSMRSGHHLVFYAFADDTITIVRVLHEREDPTRDRA